ncbi:hypothetical protein QIH93_15080 [Bradyrhizobium ottawaense]|uniref:hypothetical protein n=1 Tax=Bradyrhizobium ottawaense TaxID=931866 RepID=UPI00271478C6|nr:hypothetical protein [Bradyrhizobium ottawaense]WLB49236.1 hypothetical protein QIH93_15080 [Bradyrhizobium ottawaense]
MAVHGKEPFIKVLDSNGEPIVGAVLKVYEAGTTTYRNIYSDSSLTIPLTNPLSGSDASNASGDFPRFYMAAGTYKLRAETSAGILIWEFDNIDTGLSAGAGALPISAGGTGATTAAAARASLDVPSNSELSDLASDIATLSASIQNIVSFPQGRLTVMTGAPVLAGGVSAATAIYYTPYVGNIVPIYDGTQFNARTFSSDLTLTLNANHLSSAIYDVFIYWDGSDLQIATGVAWNTATAGSGARGTGAGTTELTRVNGLLVNKYDISYRNGATTGTLTAQLGTFVGSIYMDASAGQVTCHVGYGQSRKWGVSNAYNRVPVILKAGDPNASWAYTTNTTRAARGDTGNSLTVFSCLAEEMYELTRHNTITSAVNTGNTINGQIGIGYNSTSAFSGSTGIFQLVNSTGGTVGNFETTLAGSYVAPPSIGINVVTALENGLGNAGVTFIGQESGMHVSAKWRA